ncbi:MAG: DUF6786 family protein [Bacteroidota bacterium]
MNRAIAFFVITISLASCGSRDKGKNDKTVNDMKTDTADLYGFNREFLKKYVDVVELKSGNSAIALVPAWQGRVMTSTADGDEGFSFGWINRGLIASAVIQPHINAFGGEERLWLGPEGGQFSLYFKKGSRFVYDDWQTPDYMDTRPFEIEVLTDSSALFTCDVETENYSGTLFMFRLERNVVILPGNELKKLTGVENTGVISVAYRSENTIINEGADEWILEKGLISIWMLGMFNPSPAVVVVIPFRQGDEKVMGSPVNDNYFGKIAADRLKVTGSHIFFRADGKSRGKIGLPPLRATGIMGSFDSDNNILTLLICKLPEGETTYVNSAWEFQDNPYSGDAINSYNDGPLEDGSQMGPFYELETSSPAAALKPGEKLTHTQLTIHLTGDRASLNDVSVKVLGVSLEQIENSFK